MCNFTDRQPLVWHCLLLQCDKQCSVFLFLRNNHEILRKTFHYLFQLHKFFLSCKCHLVFNLKIDTGSESTTNKTLEELLFCAGVNEHLLTTGIFESLYAVHLAFTGWRSTFREVFCKRSTEVTLHWAPVSIL